MMFKHLSKLIIAVIFGLSIGLVGCENEEEPFEEAGEEIEQAAEETGEAIEESAEELEEEAEDVDEDPPRS